MRITTIVLSFTFLLCAAFSVAAQDKGANAASRCVVEISDMACSSCAATVKKALLKIDGVKSAEVSQPSGTADITYDSSKTNPDALAKAITKKTGFPAKPRSQG